MGVAQGAQRGVDSRFGRIGSACELVAESLLRLLAGKRLEGAVVGQAKAATPVEARRLVSSRHPRAAEQSQAERFQFERGVASDPIRPASSVNVPLPFGPHLPRLAR